MDQQLRVLMIDDDTGVLRALALVLEMLRFQVTPFSSPYEAVEFVVEHATSVDVVLTDLRMPGLSGEDVLRELQRRTPQIPVVVMSSHATPTDVAKLRALGATDVLPKPFTPDRVLSVMLGIRATHSQSIP